MTSDPAGQDPKSLRASDRDREQTAEILREAAGDGRLGMDELDDRLNAVYAAKTYADLEPIIKDLPHGDVVPTPAPVATPAAEPARFGGEPTSSAAIAIMGGFSRKGEWVVPETFTAVAIMAGGEIDLREAKFAERVVTIHATTIMGGIAIIVPDDAEVHVTGVGLMGAFEHGPTGPGKPGAPKIIINGVAFWGAVDVKRKPRKAESLSPGDGLSRHHETRYGLRILRSGRVELPEQAVLTERRAGRHVDPHLEEERAARRDGARRPAIELVDFGLTGRRENLGQERAAIEAQGGGGRVLKPDHEARDPSALRRERRSGAVGRLNRRFHIRRRPGLARRQGRRRERLDADRGRLARCVACRYGVVVHIQAAEPFSEGDLHRRGRYLRFRRSGRAGHAPVAPLDAEYRGGTWRERAQCRRRFENFGERGSLRRQVNLTLRGCARGADQPHGWVAGQAAAAGAGVPERYRPGAARETGYELESRPDHAQLRRAAIR
jgi:hypothetical protein